MSDIRTWLEKNELGAYAERFEAERIDHDILPQLTDEALTALGLPLGDRLRLLSAIKDLEAPPAPRQEAERRQITVMFCDLVGSTALSEKLDPEDLRTLMQAYQQAAGTVIERYGGHVAQYLGDGLMTYFGWPQAHEDDAERAVRASLDIVEAVNGMDLQVRIGIATGPVVVGETGAGDASVPKLAVGETPNLAARLQGLAGADEIVIGPSTRRLLGGTFELADMGEQALKGIVEPVPAHRVAGIAATEGRFEAQHPHLTPLVGREAEMAMVMARWSQACAGEGQVIVLSGEPGIGKSRITQALRERVADEPHTRLRYQCSPYHTNSALHPVIEQIERAAGFTRDDTSDEKLGKLEALFPTDTGRALVASLLSLPIERYPALAMSPQKQKEETLRTLAEQVTALAAAQPVLLIFEDAHWVDPTSQELLDLIVPLVADHRVLAVITHRPEYTPPWTGQGHVAPLALTRLGRAEAAAMVARVTDTPLPDAVLDQIVAKTDGVPLFVEELTKTVIESGAETANAIPETLQDSLMARLDRLSPVKEVAQIGACIGREFSHELLAAVSPLNDNELGDALQQLVNSDLIFRSGASYAFKHALVQDAAYASLLKSRRQQLHQRIALVVLQKFEQLVQSRPEWLARHLTEAGSYEQAIPYWYQAGRLAFVASAFPEAISHLRDGLRLLLEVRDEKIRNRAELGLQTLLGLSLLSMYGYGADPVIEAFGRAEHLIEHAENVAEIIPVLSSIGIYHWVRGNYPKSEVYLHKMRNVAQGAEDNDLAVLGNCMHGSVLMHLGRGSEGIHFLDESLKDYDQERHRELSIQVLGSDIGIWAAAWKSFTQCFRGYLDQAWTHAQYAVELTRDIRHPVSIASGLSMAAYGATHLRRPEPALAWAEELVNLCEEQSIPFWLGWAKIARGASRALLGDIDNGIDDLKSVRPIMDGALNGSMQHGR